MTFPNRQSAVIKLSNESRFILGAGRCIWTLVRQATLAVIRGYSDTDRAGCLRTRRSMSCTVLFHGKHFIGASSTTQNVVALSSGESEFYGFVKTCSRLLGLRALALDFGLTLAAQAYVDSTACKGVASRRGVGKIRHTFKSCGCSRQYKRNV